VQTLKETEIN